jgi:hypothetical protein
MRMEKVRPTEWHTILECISRDFPDPEDALRLKQASLAAPARFSQIDAVEAAWRVLDFLYGGPVRSPYRRATLDLREVVPALWEHQRENLLGLLDWLLHNRSREDARPLLEAVANLLQARDLSEIWKLRPELLASFISLRPELAQMREAWTLPQAGQWALVEALEHRDLADKFWGGVISAMLAARTDVAVSIAVQRAKAKAIEGAIQWLHNEPALVDLPSALWREALWRQAADRIRDVKISPAEFAFCIALLPPAIATEIPATDEAVQTLTRLCLEELPPAIRTYAAFYLTSLALHAPGKVAAELLARGFFATHRALATNSYSPEAWQLLQPSLPNSWFWPEWDKCERLRNGIIDMFSRNPSAFETLRRSATSWEDRQLAESLR